ncbi:glutathione S-transferase, partial [Vibrio splendidus]
PNIAKYGKLLADHPAYQNAEQVELEHSN